MRTTTMPFKTPMNSPINTLLGPWLGTVTMAEAIGRKRRRGGGGGGGGERVFRFKSFGEHGYPVEFVGRFRENVVALLGFGQWESGDCGGGLRSWSFQLQVQRQPPFHVVLFVVEEPVEAATTAGRHCKECQYVGWGHHMICNKRYHFVLPSKETMMAASSNNNNPGLSRSLSLRLVELQGHILHGVFHSNGFGHLLCLNGLEMGSNLPGYLVMDFWDRLCNALKARKVSLRDISQKQGMELRLLHGVAHGHPWFGHWGYNLHRAAFSTTLQTYQKALSALQRLPLTALATANSNCILPATIAKYQSLSDHPLLTLRDLLRFVLGLQSSTGAGEPQCSLAGALPETTCRWSAKRVEMAVRVVVEALKRAEFRWVSRQEVRDAARMYIGDTGLLDFVLKSLGNHVVGNYLVRRTLNPVTKVLEYCLQDVCSAVQIKPRCKVVGRAELVKDIFNIYRYILGDQKPLQAKGLLPTLTMATEIVLDAKFLVKEYTGEPPAKPELEIEGRSNLFCTVRFKHQEATTTLPYECIAMKNNATIDELKEEVERNLREIYWGLRSFVVEGTVDLEAQGRDLVFGLVEVGGKLVFEGNYGGNENGISLFFNNGGMDKRIVECVCGAVEDDGERMVACDICEIWQHTRCVQIPNDQQVPHIFICNRCDQEIALLHSLP